MVAAGWSTHAWCRVGALVIVSADPTCIGLIIQLEQTQILFDKQGEFVGVSVTSWNPTGAGISANQGDLNANTNAFTFNFKANSFISVFFLSILQYVWIWSNIAHTERRVAYLALCRST